MRGKAFLELSYHTPLQQVNREKIANAYNRGDKKVKYLLLKEEEIKILKKWGYVINKTKNKYEVEI